MRCHQTTAATVLALLAARTTAQNNDLDSSAGCWSFEPVAAYGVPAGSTYNTTFQSMRISQGIACNETLATASNGTCPLQSWAYLTFSARYNITWTGDDQDSEDADLSVLASAIANATDLPIMPGDINGIVANRTWYISQGQNAFIDFTEVWDCVNGVLSDCRENSGVDNGTAIQACMPTYNTGSGDVPIFYKIQNIVNTGADVVNLTTYPYSTNTTSDNDENAAHGLGVNMAGVLAVAGLVAAFMM